MKPNVPPLWCVPDVVKRDIWLPDAPTKPKRDNTVKLVTPSVTEMTVVQVYGGLT